MPWIKREKLEQMETLIANQESLLKGLKESQCLLEKMLEEERTRATSLQAKIRNLQVEIDALEEDASKSRASEKSIRSTLKDVQVQAAERIVKYKEQLKTANLKVARLEREVQAKT